MTTQRRVGDVLLADIVSPQFVSANIALFFSVVELMKFVNQISMLQRNAILRRGAGVSQEISRLRRAADSTREDVT
jgi:hypothetical protein